LLRFAELEKERAALMFPDMEKGRSSSQFATLEKERSSLKEGERSPVSATEDKKRSI
jgi:hypothetical protein